jgi:hypothetical protein
MFQAVESKSSAQVRLGLFKRGTRSCMASLECTRCAIFAIGCETPRSSEMRASSRTTYGSSFEGPKKADCSFSISLEASQTRGYDVFLLDPWGLSIRFS